jgi:hypothetical protein
MGPIQAPSHTRTTLQQHINAMQADYGGTVISNLLSRGNQMLEIMVLTDGKVWGVEELFKVVEAQRREGVQFGM